MPRMKRAGRRYERGQILPLLAFGIFAILGVVALSVDVGYWRYQQRVEQSAADSAAIAGAIQQGNPATGSTLTVTSVAQTTAANAPFGFVHDGVDTIVSVSTTPSPRPGATAYPASTAVEVIISKKQPNFFASIFGGSPTFVSARAVAITTVDGSACLYQLADSVDNGFLTSKGKNSINLRKCGLLSNGAISDNPGGFSGDTTYVGYNGSISQLPSSPTKSAKLQQIVTDPCPAIPTCRNTQALSQSLPATPPATGTIDAAKVVAGTVVNPNPLTPYSTPVYVNNCCSGTTYFTPGIYYVYQGSASSMGPIYTTSVSGFTGTTIINVNGSLVESGLGTGAPIMTAPSTGPTAGVAYFQPANNGVGTYNPSVVYPTSCKLNGGGNNTTEIHGLFYAPSADCTWNGGSVTFAYAVLGSIRDNGGGSGDSITVDPSLNPIVPFGSGNLTTHAVIDQ